MTRLVQMFLALTNAPIAAYNLVQACLPATTIGMFLLHMLAFAFSATVGLHIWNDR